MVAKKKSRPRSKSRKSSSSGGGGAFILFMLFLAACAWGSWMTWLWYKDYGRAEGGALNMPVPQARIQKEEPPKESAASEKASREIKRLEDANRLLKKEKTSLERDLRDQQTEMQRLREERDNLMVKIKILENEAKN